MRDPANWRSQTTNIVIHSQLKGEGAESLVLKMRDVQKGVDMVGKISKRVKCGPEFQWHDSFMKSYSQLVAIFLSRLYLRDTLEDDSFPILNYVPAYCYELQNGEFMNMRVIFAEPEIPGDLKW